MLPNKALWQFIHKNLLQETSVILLYVVESKGSSPGRQGFGMAINANNQMQGSIGGGIMEHKFIELAKEFIRNKVEKPQIVEQYHNKTAKKNQSGMICSGEQTILVYPVKKADLSAIQAINENANGFLSFSEKGISFSIKSTHLENPPLRGGLGGVINSVFFSQLPDNQWFYEEKLGYQNHLYIVGGGHCSLALSKIMQTLDFHIHLFDDRQNLKTFEENTFVHEKTYLDSYTELQEIIPSGENVYVVIMTFGYRTDDIALRALLHKKFKYLGVLGSKNKIAQMLNDYKDFPKEFLDNLHAPIGLPIHSKTPDEIAISIAAEIIQVKNNQ